MPEMLQPRAKLPMRLVLEFERDPIIVGPWDGFPWGIIIWDVLRKVNPDVAMKLEELGWEPMLVPRVER